MGFVFFFFFFFLGGGGLNGICLMDFWDGNWCHIWFERDWFKGGW